MSNLKQDTITPNQCRAARAIIGWTQSDLEIKSKVTRKTLADFEAGKRQPYDRTLADIRKTLEAAGVVFLDEGQQVNGGAGVRLSLSPVIQPSEDQSTLHGPLISQQNY
jgi:transcriptional regulator with XRE-family HTH domain